MKVPEEYRITSGPLASDSSFGNNGAFIIPFFYGVYAYIIASDGEGWEHVSVHIHSNGRDRTPSWDEMCRIKSLFWDDQDTVIQYHPRKSEYVNHHSHCLHLWKPIGIEIPLPPSELVGPKEKGAGEIITPQSIESIGFVKKPLHTWNGNGQDWQPPNSVMEQYDYVLDTNDGYCLIVRFEKSLYRKDDKDPWQVSEFISVHRTEFHYPGVSDRINGLYLLNMRHLMMLVEVFTMNKGELTPEVVRCSVCLSDSVKHTIQRAGANTYYCCKCWVFKGYAPADWHGGCVNNKENDKGENNEG